MTASALTYNMPTFTGLLNHGPAVTFFCDQEPIDEIHPLDIEVRSGDYFITLATNLDLLGQNVTNRYIRASIDNIVSDLVYLQNNYRITKDDSAE